MRFVFERDVSRFASAARPFVDAHVECNVLATVLIGVQEGRHADHPPILAHGVDEQGNVAAVAVRTPPWPMICSGLDPGAADQLIGAWLEQDPELNGVNSPAPTARALAAAWQRRTGGGTRCRTSMAFHTLNVVTDPPRPGAGRLSQASNERRDLLVAWWRDFAVEAGVFGAGADATEAVDGRLGHSRLWLWQAPGGAPVSMVAVNAPVAGVVRLGPVYTPPARLCRCGGRRRQSPSAPGRCPRLHALRRPRESDLQQDLCRGRLPSRRRMGGAPLHARRG